MKRCFLSEVVTETEFTAVFKQLFKKVMCKITEKLKDGLQLSCLVFLNFRKSTFCPLVFPALPFELFNRDLISRYKTLTILKYHQLKDSARDIKVGLMQ